MVSLPETWQDTSETSFTNSICANFPELYSRVQYHNEVNLTPGLLHSKYKYNKILAIIYRYLQESKS